MQNKTENEILREKLSACKTLGEMFTVIRLRYDVDKTEVGLISKPIIIQGLLSAREMLNPKRN